VTWDRQLYFPPKEGMLWIFSPEKSDGFGLVRTRDLTTIIGNVMKYTSGVVEESKVPKGWFLQGLPVESRQTIRTSPLTIRMQ
jgi:hypothetical protein